MRNKEIINNVINFLDSDIGYRSKKAIIEINDIIKKYKLCDEEIDLICHLITLSKHLRKKKYEKKNIL